MKKIFFILCLFLTSLLQGDEPEIARFFREDNPPSYEEPPPPPARRAERKGPLWEVKFGYFMFARSKMRRVYNRGGLDVQISSSLPMSRYLQAYGSVEYFQRSGRSLNAHQRASIHGFPLSAGLNFVVPTKSSYLDYYCCVGPRYFIIWAHQSSNYVDKHVGNNGVGGFVSTGFLFSTNFGMTINTFAEYSNKKLFFVTEKLNVKGHGVQVGGLTFGGALGYHF